MSERIWNFMVPLIISNKITNDVVPSDKAKRLGVMAAILGQQHPGSAWFSFLFLQEHKKVEIEKTELSNKLKKTIPFDAGHVIRLDSWKAIVNAVNEDVFTNRQLPALLELEKVRKPRPRDSVVDALEAKLGITKAENQPKVKQAPEA